LAQKRPKSGKTIEGISQNRRFGGFTIPSTLWRTRDSTSWRLNRATQPLVKDQVFYMKESGLRGVWHIALLMRDRGLSPCPLRFGEDRFGLSLSEAPVQSRRNPRPGSSGKAIPAPGGNARQANRYPCSRAGRQIGVESGDGERSGKPRRMRTPPYGHDFAHPIHST
jgi:hypothetical protein